MKAFVRHPLAIFLAGLVGGAVVTGIVMLLKLREERLQAALQSAEASQARIQSGIELEEARRQLADRPRHDAIIDVAIKQKKEAEAAKLILEGQSEREVWLKLARFLQQAAPLPDGSNLSPEAQKFGWENAAGQAVDKLSGKARGDRLAAAAEASDPDLTQVVIEQIDPRYTTDLTSCWKRALATVTDRGAVRGTDSSAELPGGAGWVVALHGYTYHQAKETFLREGFVKNLSRFADNPPRVSDAEPRRGDGAEFRAGHFVLYDTRVHPGRQPLRLKTKDVLDSLFPAEKAELPVKGWVSLLPEGKDGAGRDSLGSKDTPNFPRTEFIVLFVVK
jgi:hypothetical protein